ncbi:hypothetical protein PUNSTDRAFT_123941 [Punctularia strigosozonata HHB-11173 SS5]|uniref:uncharacterized protein n=1 Tax=Punctularia strigosozonata (strain HHB-11173) TaxID=741275 RepID=UPI0004417AC8|nr:uncharacterized protein PUNSTDRAFT_123941 [Punctularia strigosozonata HHB-11173 SS5]EIN14367.1 hypothetical protein PUNSTDRAFT_123941 [Punctularia strigosozonata HHB-11173 SS5]
MMISKQFIGFIVVVVALAGAAIAGPAPAPLDARMCECVDENGKPCCCMLPSTACEARETTANRQSDPNVLVEVRILLAVVSLCWGSRAVNSGSSPDAAGNAVTVSAVFFDECTAPF